MYSVLVVDDEIRQREAVMAMSIGRERVLRLSAAPKTE